MARNDVKRFGCQSVHLVVRHGLLLVSPDAAVRRQIIEITPSTRDDPEQAWTNMNSQGCKKQKKQVL